MGEFNSDEINPPSWLDKTFLETVLKTCEKDDTIVIKEFKITPGSGKGDHVSSIIFRADTEYSSHSGINRSRSMIIKTVPNADGFKKELLDKSPVFVTEINMYSKEVPKFEELLKKHGDNTQFGPKILYHALEPQRVIVLEDLEELGYTCVRGRFINIDETKLCLLKVAKWHAASYKLASEGDESVKSFREGLLTRPKEELPPFIGGGLELLIEGLSKVKEFKMFAKKLKAIEATFIEKCNDLFNAHSRGLPGIMVLNHGDFHAKNAMFKYDADGKVQDVAFFDYQISVYAPAAVDISYAIFLLFTDDMRRNHREELIQYYFSSFLETLTKINFEGELPKLADFYADMVRYKEFELWNMATFFPIVCSIVAGAGTIQLDDLLSTKEALSRMYLEPSFLEQLKWLLPKYLENGYLEKDKKKCALN